MTSLKPFPVRSTIALALAAWLAAGCSGSDDSSSTNGAGAIGTPAGMTSNDPATGTDGLSTGVFGTEPTGAAPTGEAMTQVDVDISVPAYASDALRVTLAWDDVSARATWIGDESWSASLALPSDREESLRVTFWDRNGDLALASYETALRTGGDAQSLVITAEQFDSARYDDDNDGTSNLDELIAGTGPWANGESLFGDYVRFDDVEKLAIIGRASGFYELELPMQRPFVMQSDSFQPYDREIYQDQIAQAVDIDIDAAGNGRFSDTYRLEEPSNVHVEDQVATRRVENGAVIWSGTDTFSDYSAALVENIAFTTTTRRIDERTFRQQGTIERTKSGDWSGGNYTISMSYDLTGREANGAPVCNPRFGTISYQLNAQTYAAPLQAPITTLTAEPGDEYWSVSVTGTSGEITSQYRVQTIDTVFHCEFGEL